MRGTSFFLVFLSLLVMLFVPQAGASVIYDPVGDTFGDNIIDVTQLSAYYDNNYLYIYAQFNNDIYESGTGDIYDLYGYIDLDIDQNDSTGTVSYTDIYGGNTGLGMEYYLDFFDSSVDNQIELYDQYDNFVSKVPISFGINDFTITLPLTLISDDGAVNLAAVFGNYDGPDDIVPNSGYLTSSPLSNPVPEPATGLLLAAGLGLIPLVRRKKK